MNCLEKFGQESPPLTLPGRADISAFIRQSWAEATSPQKGLILIPPRRRLPPTPQEAPQPPTTRRHLPAQPKYSASISPVFK
jgi:hypothetical protein